MTIKIVHENENFALYVNGQFYGNYDSPVQAAQAVEEMNIKEDDQDGRQT